jgi:hypothetical protein
MVASPYKITMNVKGASTPSFTFSADDVNGDAITFPDGISTSNNFGNQNVVITDVIVTGTPTDTTQLQLYVGGQVQPYIITLAANAYNVLQRQVMGNPIGISAGKNVSFVQLT